MKVQTNNSNTRKLLFSTLLIIAALLLPLGHANAQELNARKHGTIREQIEQAPINQRHSVVDQLLSYAFQFRGVPYRYGQMSPRGFDCSGFTSYVFKRFGFTLDRSSRGQINDGRRIDRSELKPGDLVFFSGRGNGRGIGHVGIVTEVQNERDFKFIHAACHTGITVSHSSETYYSRRYRGACRVID